jgi:two-component sensor histidine kinase
LLQQSEPVEEDVFSASLKAPRGAEDRVSEAETATRWLSARGAVRPRRIRTYLVLFALALVLPLLLVSVIALNRMAAIEEAQIEGRVPQLARNLAVGVDQELDRAVVTLETLATSSELRRGDLRAFHQQAILALKSKKAAIVLIDRSYRQLVDTLKDYGAPLPPTADAATAQRVIDTGRPQVSDLFRGSVNGLPVFNVEVPVLDAAGQVQNVLIMSFQAAHISDLLEHQFRLPPGWIAGVTDKNGMILARSERSEQYVGTALPEQLLAQTKTLGGVYKAVNVAGEAILRATSRSERSGWYVSATVPLSYVQEPRLRSYSFAGLLLGSAIVLGWGFAYFFARLMARPLDEATRAAASLGQGNDVQARTTALVEANALLETLAEASRELNQRAEHATFLMRELAHRAKNQLAVIKGMALQTSRQSATVGEFIAQFDRRIQGLAQSQDVLLRQNWRGAWLGELVHAHVDLFGADDRISVEGPSVFLDAMAVQNVGFALHELATNAFKHGALAVPGGKVAVSWTAREQDAVHLVWVEEGGPSAAGPTRRGFGHRVITDLVPRWLNGASKLEFLAGGVRWQLDIPSHHILSDNSAAANER